MERFSPKIEIINHFDSLINRIDIDIDSSLERFNDKKLISDMFKSYFSDCYYSKCFIYLNINFFDTIDSFKPKLNPWPESTKLVDYLKHIRMQTIEELKKAQEETLENYKLNSDRFKSELTKEKNIEELKSELFAEKFFFQVNFKQSDNRFWTFKVFTFVTDFYMSQSNIDLLE